ncbi:MAG: glutamine amidotransferase [Arcobacteraceae bacterium]
MKYIYIIKTGETFQSIEKKHGDFDQWIIDFLGRTNKNIKVISVLENEKLPSLKSALGFIITGSHAMVSQELPWSVKLEKYIQKISIKEVPLLGICYGHQLIAKALGGKSGFNRKGKEIGKVKINIAKRSRTDPLFQNFPKKFNAFETHYQSVLKLPSDAIILASNFKDKHQAVRYSKNIWGVQFHPEFNKTVMNKYIQNQEKNLIKLGFNIETLLNNIDNCHISHKILTNFLNIIEHQDHKL